MSEKGVAMPEYVFVTGATRGLGRAVATHMSRSGYTVICTGRERQALDEVMEELSGQGHISHVADLTHASAVTELSQKVNVAVGSNGLRAFIHCAALTPDPEAEADLGETSLALLDDHLMVTAKSGVALLRELKPTLALSAQSHAIHMSTDWTVPGYAGPPAFAASKEYLAAAWRHARREFLRSGIVLSRIVAGNIATYDEDWQVPKWSLDSTKDEVAAELGATRIFIPDIIAAIHLIMDADMAAFTDVHVAPLDPDYVP